MSLSKKQDRRTRWQRLTAGATLSLFLTTQSFSSGFTPLVHAAEAGGVSIKTQPPLDQIKIPTFMGRVEEVFKASSNQTVIVVQDAHAVPAAQKSIHQLIRYFESVYGLSTVALEGAAKQLDPQIFRSFPDQKRLKEVMKSYLMKGELSGGTAAAIFSKNPKTTFRGVEDWSLYEEGIGLYQRALNDEKRILKKLEVGSLKLEEKKTQVYSTQLLEIDRVLSVFNHGRGDLSVTLKKLAEVKRPEKGTELEALLEEIERETTDQSAVEAEVRGIAEAMQVASRQSLVVSGKQKKFEHEYQEFQTGQLSAQAFALFLQEFLMSVPALYSRLMTDDPRLSAKLTRLSGQQKTLRDIEGTKFFAAFEAYAGSVKESLMTREAERELDRKSRTLELSEKMAKLELTRDEWEQVKGWKLEVGSWKGNEINGNEKASGEDPSPSVISTSFVFSEQPAGEAAAKEPTSSLQTSNFQLQTLFKDHFSFYENAEARDAAFLENLSSFQTPDSQLSLIVAGGFHAKGVTQRLKKQGISYVLVIPAIKTIPNETNYQVHMRGDVSWKQYFEVENGSVSLYKAFVRAVRDSLLELEVGSSKLEEKAVSEKNIQLLKYWRDQIIRDLADQGRIEKAGGYTRYIDEVRRPGLSNGRSMVQSSAVTLDALTRVERFIAGLKDLLKRDAVTSQNILGILHPATAIPPVESPLLLSTEVVPAALLGFGVQRSEVRGRVRPEKIRLQRPVPVAGENDSLPDDTRSYIDRHQTQWRWISEHVMEPILDRAESRAKIAGTSPEIRMIDFGSASGEEAMRLFYEVSQFLEQSRRESKNWKIVIDGVDYNEKMIQMAERGLAGRRAFFGAARTNSAYAQTVIDYANQNLLKVRQSISFGKGDILHATELKDSYPQADLVIVNHLLRIDETRAATIVQQLEKTWPDALLALGDRQSVLELADLNRLEHVTDLLPAVDPANMNETRYAYVLSDDLAEAFISRSEVRMMKPDRIFLEQDDERDFELEAGEKVRNYLRLTVEASFGHQRGNGSDERQSLGSVLARSIGGPENFKTPIKVLDVGTGKGDFPIAFKPELEALGYQAEIIGVDRHSKAEAQINLGQNYKVFDFSDEESVRQNLGDQSFDLITMNAPDILNSARDVGDVRILRQGNFAAQLYQAEKLLSKNGAIFIRLFEPKDYGRTMDYVAWLRAEGAVLRQTLDDFSDFEFSEMSRASSPVFALGATPLGPLIVLQRKKTQRSEVRAAKKRQAPAASIGLLSQAEKAIIRKSLKNGLKRLGAAKDEDARLWLFGEQEVLMPFIAGQTEGVAGDIPQVSKELYQNKKTLVLPGYGNLPFFLRLFGAESVVALDADPATIAWQKLKAMAGRQKMADTLFSVFENSRPMVRQHYQDQWMHYLDAPPAKDGFSNLEFRIGNILEPLSPSAEKYDLIVVPYLFGFPNGLMTEKDWDLAFNNLKAVLNVGGRIIFFPGKVNVDKLKGQAFEEPKATSEKFSRWLEQLVPEGVGVTHSVPYDFYHFIGSDAAKASFSTLTLLPEDEAKQRRSEVRQSKIIPAYTNGLPIPSIPGANKNLDRSRSEVRIDGNVESQNLSPLNFSSWDEIFGKTGELIQGEIAAIIRQIAPKENFDDEMVFALTPYVLSRVWLPGNSSRMDEGMVELYLKKLQTEPAFLKSESEQYRELYAPALASISSGTYALDSKDSLGERIRIKEQIGNMIDAKLKRGEKSILFYFVGPSTGEEVLSVSGILYQELQEKGVSDWEDWNIRLIGLERRKDLIQMANYKIYSTRLSDKFSSISNEVANTLLATHAFESVSPDEAIAAIAEESNVKDTNFKYGRHFRPISKVANWISYFRFNLFDPQMAKAISYFGRGDVIFSRNNFRWNLLSDPQSTVHRWYGNPSEEDQVAFGQLGMMTRPGGLIIIEPIENLNSDAGYQPFGFRPLNHPKYGIYLNSRETWEQKDDSPKIKGEASPESGRSEVRRADKINFENGLPVPAAQGTSAKHLIDAFQLEKIKTVEARADAGGLKVFRVKTNEALAAVRPPQGPDLFQAHLAPTNHFELLYNSKNQLIAVFPVMTNLKEGVSYFDFSDYYPHWPKPGETDALSQWKKYIELRNQNRQAIENYKKSYGLGEAQISRKWHSEAQAPFILAQINPRVPGSRPSVSQFEPEKLIRDAEAGQRDAQYHLAQLENPSAGEQSVLYMLYPTVYSPGNPIHRAQDSQYYQTVTEKAAKILTEDGGVHWDDAGGSGIGSWLVYQYTRDQKIRRLYSDINALAEANARQLASIAGFELETAVSDTSKAVFSFENVPTIDFASSNSGAFSLVQDKADVLETAFQKKKLWWDNDVNGVYLKGFSSILGPRLSHRGMAVTWNVVPFFDAAAEIPIHPQIKQALESGGLAVKLYYDDHSGVGESIVTIEMTPLKQARAEVRSEQSVSLTHRFQPLDDREASGLAEKIWLEFNRPGMLPELDLPQSFEGFLTRGSSESSIVVPGEKDAEIVVRQVGPLVFVIADRMTEVLSKILKEKLDHHLERYPGNIFLTEKAVYLQHHTDLGYFTTHLISVMLKNAKLFENAVVSDFGAGHGILSQVALALGAKHVMLADYSTADLKLAGMLLNAQGAFEDSSTDGQSGTFSMHSADFMAPEGAKIIAELARRADVTLVNIGPWTQYLDVNETVLKILAEQPHWKLLLNSGYRVEKNEVDHREELKQSFELFSKSPFSPRIFREAGRSELSRILWVQRLDPETAKPAESTVRSEVRVTTNSESGLPERLSPSRFQSFSAWLAADREWLKPEMTRLLGKSRGRMISTWFQNKYFPVWSDLESLVTAWNLEDQEAKALYRLRYQARDFGYQGEAPLSEVLPARLPGISVRLHTAAAESLKIFEAALKTKVNDAAWVNQNQLGKNAHVLQSTKRQSIVTFPSFARESMLHVTMMSLGMKGLTANQPFDFAALVNKENPDEYILFVYLTPGHDALNDQVVILTRGKDGKQTFYSNLTTTPNLSFEEIEAKAPQVSEILWQARRDYFSLPKNRDAFVGKWLERGLGDKTKYRGSAFAIGGADLEMPDIYKYSVWEPLRGHIHLLGQPSGKQPRVVIRTVPEGAGKETAYRDARGRYDYLFFSPADDGQVSVFSSLQFDAAQGQDQPDAKKPLLMLSTLENHYISKQPLLQTFFINALAKLGVWNVTPLFPREVGKGQKASFADLGMGEGKVAQVYFGRDFVGAVARLTPKGQSGRSAGVPVVRIYKVPAAQLDESGNWSDTAGRIIASGNLKIAPDGTWTDDQDRPLPQWQTPQLVTDFTFFDDGYFELGAIQPALRLKGTYLHMPLLADLLTEKGAGQGIQVSAPFRDLGPALPPSAFGNPVLEGRTFRSQVVYHIFPSLEMKVEGEGGEWSFDAVREVWHLEMPRFTIIQTKQAYDSETPQIVFHEPISHEALTAAGEALEAAAARSEVRGALKFVESQPSFAITSAEERERLQKAAVQLAEKIHTMPNQPKKVLTMPGSGQWAGQILQAAWQALYPDEPLEFYDMGGENWGARRAELASSEGSFLVLDDAGKTLKAMNAVRPDLESHFESERLTYAVLYAGKFPANPEAFYAESGYFKESLEAYRASFPFLQGRFVYGEAVDESVLDQGLPVWHLVRRLGKTGAKSQLLRDILGPLPYRSLMEAIEKARQKALEETRSQGFQQTKLSTEKAGEGAAEMFLRSWFPHVIQDLTSGLQSTGQAQLKIAEEPLPISQEQAPKILHDFRNVVAPVYTYAHRLLADSALPQDSSNRSILESFLKMTEPSKLLREKKQSAAVEEVTQMLEAYREFASDPKNLAVFRAAFEELHEPASYIDGIETMLQGIFRKILEFSGDDSLSVTNLRAILDDTVLSEVSAGELIKDYQTPENTEIRVPPLKFSRVILNLIRNAKEAMLEKETAGKVYLRTKLLSDRQTMQVAIEIEDEGIGIPEDKLTSIWDPDYTTKVDGTGLGLASVKEIVEQELKGTIQVRSVLGQGTVFTIEMPIEPAPKPLKIFPVDSAQEPERTVPEPRAKLNETETFLKAAEAFYGEIIQVLADQDIIRDGRLTKTAERFKWNNPNGALRTAYQALQDENAPLVMAQLEFFIELIEDPLSSQAWADRYLRWKETASRLKEMLSEDTESNARSEVRVSPQDKALWKKLLQIQPVAVYPGLGRVLDVQDALLDYPAAEDRLLFNRHIVQVVDEAFDFLDEPSEVEALEVEPGSQEWVFIDEKGRVRGHAYIDHIDNQPQMITLATTKSSDYVAGRGQALMNAALKSLKKKGKREITIKMFQESLPFYENYFKQRNIPVKRPSPVKAPFTYLADFGGVSDEMLTKIFMRDGTVLSAKSEVRRPDQQDGRAAGQSEIRSSQSILSEREAERFADDLTELYYLLAAAQGGDESRVTMPLIDTILQLLKQGLIEAKPHALLTLTDLISSELNRFHGVADSEEIVEWMNHMRETHTEALAQLEIFNEPDYSDLVFTPGRGDAVLILGPSMSGKSSLATALQNKDYSLGGESDTGYLMLRIPGYFLMAGAGSKLETIRARAWSKEPELDNRRVPVQNFGAKIALVKAVIQLNHPDSYKPAGRSRKARQPFITSLWVNDLMAVRDLGGYGPLGEPVLTVHVTHGYVNAEGFRSLSNQIDMILRKELNYNETPDGTSSRSEVRGVDRNRRTEIGESPREAFTNYYGALRTLMPQDPKQKWTVFSVAAGPSVRDLYLSTGFTKAYFMDEIPLSMDKLKAAQKELVAAEPSDKHKTILRYRQKRDTQGYADASLFENDLEYGLLKELEDLGVAAQGLVFSLNEKDAARIQIQFELEGVRREIEWITADLLHLPDALHEELRNKADVYYQKASHNLPSFYQQYLYEVSQWVKPGGLLLLNDVTSGAELVNSGEALGPIHFESAWNPVINQAQEEVEQALGITEESGPKFFYGWRMTPWRKKILTSQKRSEMRAGVWHNQPAEPIDETLVGAGLRTVREEMNLIKSELVDMDWSQVDLEDWMPDLSFREKVIRQYLQAVRYFNRTVLNAPEMNEAKFKAYFLKLHGKIGRSNLINAAGKIIDPKDNSEIDQIFEEMFSAQFAERLILNPLRTAAVIFVRLVNIQGFYDGNKRTASFVLNYILLKAGYEPFILTGDNAAEYFHIVMPIRESGKVRREEFQDFLERNVRRRSEVRNETLSEEFKVSRTEILYPDMPENEIAEWFKGKLGAGGVIVDHGILMPQDFDRDEFNADNNPWKLEYGARERWVDEELSPLVGAIMEELSLDEKNAALRVMVRHNLEKGQLPKVWAEMPVVPSILFPLKQSPKLPPRMQGTHSEITFNLIPGKEDGSYYPVMIKTGNSIDLEQEAIMDALYDRANLKEFVGVVNLPGNARGIVYRIIPAKTEVASWDVLQMEFSSSLLALKGPPSLLKTKGGSVPYDLAELFKATRMPMVSIINRYNEIYEQEKSGSGRSEVRMAEMTPNPAKTWDELHLKATALYMTLRDSNLVAQMNLNRQVLGERDTDVFIGMIQRVGRLHEFGEVVRAMPEMLSSVILAGMSAAEILDKLEPVLIEYASMDPFAEDIFREINETGAVSSVTADDLANLIPVSLENVILGLEALEAQARDRQVTADDQNTGYVQSSITLISKILEIVRQLKETYPEGAAIGLAITEGMDPFGNRQIADQHARALAGLAGMIERMIVIGRLPEEFQTILEQQGFSGARLTLESNPRSVSAPDGQARVPVVEVGASLKEAVVSPEILRVLLGTEGYESDRDNYSFYTLSTAVALQYAFSVMAALQLKKGMDPSEISGELLRQLDSQALNLFDLSRGNVSIMINAVKTLINEFQARSEIRQSA